MVYVHLADGFEEIEAITPVDVFRRAEIPVKTVSITGNLLVTGAHGIPIKADLLFEQVNYDDATMILLPGGMPGTNNLAEHKGLTEAIREFADENKWIAAICAAPMILGELGLLDAKKAVIYPGMEQYLRGAKPGKHRVEIDGNIVTSKGPGTAMEFALAIVELLKGKVDEEALRKSMVIK